MKFTKAFWLLGSIFILLRLFFIFTFPPFTDESIYIRWGQMMVDNPLFRWASIEYIHRQPLAFWLFGIGAIVFKNPLVGARIVVLLINIPTFFMMYALTKRIANEKIANYALGILALSPLFILTQSLALMDGLLFGIGALVLWIFIYPWKQKFILCVGAVSILLGIALWIKTTAVFLCILSLLGILYKYKQEKQKPSILIFSFTVSVAVIFFILSPLLGQKEVYNIFNEPGSFAFSLEEINKFPVSIWSKNIVTAIYSLFIYLHPISILAMAACVLLRKKCPFPILLLWFAIPTIFTIIVGKNLITRYFVFSTIILVPYIAYCVVTLGEKAKTTWVVIFFWILSFAYSLFFVVKPTHFFLLFPATSQERDYALSWPSGYGITELVQWIDHYKEPESQLLIAVADSMGNPSDYILAYYYFRRDVQVTFITLTTLQEFEKIKPVALKRPLYVVTRSGLIQPDIVPYLIPIQVFHKPYSDETVGIYRISFTNIPSSL